MGPRARNLVESYTTELAGPDALDDDTARAACAIGVIHSVSTGSITDPAKAKAVILGAALAVLDAQRLTEAAATPKRRRS